MEGDVDVVARDGEAMIRHRDGQGQHRQLLAIAADDSDKSTDLALALCGIDTTRNRNGIAAHRQGGHLCPVRVAAPGPFRLPRFRAVIPIRAMLVARNAEFRIPREHHTTDPVEATVASASIAQACPVGIREPFDALVLQRDPGRPLGFGREDLRFGVHGYALFLGLGFGDLGEVALAIEVLSLLFVGSEGACDDLAGFQIEQGFHEAKRLAMHKHHVVGVIASSIFQIGNDLRPFDFAGSWVERANHNATLGGCRSAG